MGWDFETDPQYQEKLDWVEQFMREDVEPLDYVLGAELLEHEVGNDLM